MLLAAHLDDDCVVFRYRSDEVFRGADVVIVRHERSIGGQEFGLDRVSASLTLDWASVPE